MSLPKGATKPRPYPRTQPIALTERAHVHDAVAAELGIDPDVLIAEIADAVREPLVIRELVTS